MKNLQPGDMVNGFETISIDILEEYQGEGRTFRHTATGCEVFHLYREDPENLFAFVFKTPPRDNTGAAHILEHAVLSGSRRYPVKDPFQSMMKGSMNTFMNAMTYPDKTVFPAASPVEKDYFNLLRVYADAVFFPLLKKEIFQQEGHRYTGEGDDLGLGGIVYNEMKGAYSSHDTLVGEYSYRFLFPDSPYQYDSGGEPAVIPDLTYEQFVDFHRRYYHPANCRIFLYGDIPTEKQLAVLQDEFLHGFEAGTPAPAIEVTPSWEAPRLFQITSPTGGDEDEDPEGDESEGAGGTITVNWKGLPLTDPVNLLAMEVLSEMLLGNVGSPLYKAVVESGLGEDVSPVSGLDSELRESVFSIGIRGAGADTVPAFEELVLSTLKELTEQGIPENLLKGALHQVEFRNREIRGGIPFGLRLMDKTLRGWLHGYDPTTPLRFSKSLESFKERLNKEPRFFEELIRREFLENPHRATVVILPDPEHLPREEALLNERLNRFKASLTREDLQRLREEQLNFEAYQSAAVDPAAEASIPCLHREDLPSDISVIETVRKEAAGRPLYSHDLFTNGLVYVDLAFDVQGLSDEETLLLPLFSRILCTAGLPGIPYHEVAHLLSQVSGGLYTFLETSLVLNRSGETRELLFFRIKALEKDLDPAVDLLERLLLTGVLSDPVRIKDLLLEQRNDFKSSLLPSGHSLASLRGAAKVSPVQAREEQWRGISQYLFLCEEAKKLSAPAGAERIGMVLESIRQKVFTRNRIILNVTAQGAALGKAEKRMSDLAEKFSPGDPVVSRPLPVLPSQGEALVVPSPVGYACRILPASLAGSLGHSREILLGHLLKTNFLWEEVRMKGGAYGVSSAANGAEGLYSFTSYRDPDPVRTFGVFRQSLEQMSLRNLSREDLDKSVIGIVGKDARPLSPGEMSMMGFRRDLYGIDNELRRKNRKQILEVTPQDIRETAERLLGDWDQGVSVLLSGPDLAEAAAKTYPDISLRLEIPL
jgi:hypothetical protein